MVDARLCGRAAASAVLFALREHGRGGAVGDGDGTSHNHGRPCFLPCEGARSYRSFSIHDRLLLRFTLKSLLLGVAVSICLTLLYGFAVGFIVNKRPLSLHVALMFAFTAVVLSLACFVLRLWASPVVAWSIVGFFIVAGLPVSSGMFEGSPILHAVIPTTWMLSGARFAGYVIPVGVVVAMASAWLLLKAVKRV